MWIDYLFILGYAEIWNIRDDFFEGFRFLGAVKLRAIEKKKTFNNTFIIRYTILWLNFLTVVDKLFIAIHIGIWRIDSRGIKLV